MSITSTHRQACLSTVLPSCLGDVEERSEEDGRTKQHKENKK
jgi:hypothetical protein